MVTLAAMLMASVVPTGVHMDGAVHHARDVSLLVVLPHMTYFTWLLPTENEILCIKWNDEWQIMEYILATRQLMWYICLVLKITANDILKCANEFYSGIFIPYASVTIRWWGYFIFKLSVYVFMCASWKFVNLIFYKPPGGISTKFTILVQWRTNMNSLDLRSKGQK